MLLAIVGGEKSYGPRSLFSDLALQLTGRSRMGIVGHNGTGKSTLLRILAGVETLDSGSVSRAADITLGYLPQQCPQVAGISIIDYVLSAQTEMLALEAEQAHLETALADLASTIHD